MKPRRLSSAQPGFDAALAALTRYEAAQDAAVESAAREGFDYAQAVRRGARLRVATKYVDTARQHFAAKGVHVDLIKLYGSMELAPLVGLADAIVDLVSSGNTLKANNLQAVEDIMPISSRLIVNQAALKMKRELLQPVIDAFAGAIK